MMDQLICSHITPTLPLLVKPPYLFSPLPVSCCSFLYQEQRATLSDGSLSRQKGRQENCYYYLGQRVLKVVIDDFTYQSPGTEPL